MWNFLLIIFNFSLNYFLILLKIFSYFYFLNMEKKERYELVFHDKKQMLLTEKYIEPVIWEIEEILIYLRKKVDKGFNWKTIAWWCVYPEWFCCEIRDIIFSIIEKNKNKVKSPFNVFAKLEKKWVLLKKNYWIQHGKYFQNWIQLWDYFLDVANDTVDINKNSIEISRLWSSWMENFTTYERYADIAEKYWNCDIYPNVYFPYLSPFYPIISIQKWRAYLLNQHTQLMIQDIEENNFQLVEDFLFNSLYSDKKLPDRFIKNLSNEFFYKEKEIDRFINSYEIWKKENFFKHWRKVAWDNFSMNYTVFFKKDIELLKNKIERVLNCN